MRRIIAQIVVFGLLLAPVQAIADDSANARLLYERGSRAYEVGEYEEVAKLLRDAYLLVPRVQLLYNIGMAEWRAGDRSSAVETFETALTRGLPEGFDSRTRARLAGFGLLERAEGVASANLAQSADDRDGTGSSSDDFSVVGWIGVATLTLAGAAGLSAGWASLEVDSLQDDLRQAAADNEPERYDTIQADIDGAQRLGQPLLVSAIVLGVLGASLVTWELSGAGKESGAEPQSRSRSGTPSEAPTKGASIDISPSGARANMWWRW